MITKKEVGEGEDKRDYIKDIFIIDLGSITRKHRVVKAYTS
jgi:hypothetical protein